MAANILRKAFLVFVLVLSISACERTIVVAPDAVLPDGSVYLGEVKNGKFHGQGKLIYDEGEYYEGRFENGLMHGQGVMVLEDGSRYEGQFNQGKATGKFKVYDARVEQRYEGDLVDYAYQGQGKLIEGDSLYQGEFFNYQYHGQGELVIENSTYKGEFVKGVFTGIGRYEYGEGTVEEGDFKDWVLNGEGSRTYKDGRRLTGRFVNGVLEGEGSYTSAEGHRYEGNFAYGEFDGQGTYTYADGRVYVGEFSYGKFHGTGTLTTPVKQGETGNAIGESAIGEAQAGQAPTIETAEKVQTGQWRYGQFEDEYQKRGEQAELALRHHQNLLDQQLRNLRPSEQGQANMYFVGLGGDGTQSVFRREVEHVREYFQSQFSINNRSISLINDHETAETYPLASRLSFKQTIDHLNTLVDTKNDVLVVYLTSHGSKKHAISLAHDSIELPDLKSDYVVDVLNNSAFKYKLIFVSACYSGGYIPLLANDDTMVLTASSASTISFGCSDSSDLTHFAKALFKETLVKQPSLALDKAFSQAQEIITKWENDESLDQSKPQIHSSRSVLLQLEKIRARETP